MRHNFVYARFPIHLHSIFFCLLFLPHAGQADERLPLVDCHIHYNGAARTMFSPEQALAWLRAAGIERALVSSTPDGNTFVLADAAPDMILPLWRPYRAASERQTWFGDASTMQRMSEALAVSRSRSYIGIGEFHVHGSQAQTPTVRAIAAYAAANKLLLHAHSDAAAVEHLFSHAPDVTVIWAHAGMDESVETVRAMLARYPQLYAELSFRQGLTHNGVVTAQWRALFADYPDRFVFGSDTWTNSRWPALPAIADLARQWLAQLPADVARRIAYENAQRLLAQFAGQEQGR